MSLSTSLRTGGAALETLAPLWDQLAKASRAPVFMQRPWARAWFAHLAPRAEPWVLVAGDPPLAIWPLALQRKRGLRVLGSAGHGVSDYLGPLAEHAAPELITACARQLRREARRYDLLDLGSLSLADELRSVLERELGRYTRERVYERCPVISVEGGWEDYLRGRTRKFRANLKRAERRATAAGPAAVQIESFSSQLFDELLAVERESWKWEVGTAYLHDPGRLAFLRAILVEPAIESEIWTCRIAGELAGFSVVFRGDGVRYYYLPSFRMRHSDVGTFLLREIVRESFASGLREVDLLQGDEGYKLAWATGERIVHEVASAGMLPTGYVGMLALRARWKVAASPRLRGALDRIKLRQPRERKRSGAAEAVEQDAADER